VVSKLSQRGKLVLSRLRIPFEVIRRKANEDLRVWWNWKFWAQICATRRQTRSTAWKLSVWELWQGDKPQLFGVDPDAQPAVCGLKYIIINWRRVNCKFESLPSATCCAQSWFIAVFNAAPEFTAAFATLSVGAPASRQHARTHTHTLPDCWLSVKTFNHPQNTEREPAPPPATRPPAPFQVLTSLISNYRSPTMYKRR